MNEAFEEGSVIDSFLFGFLRGFASSVGLWLTYLYYRC